jgi:hypothetical protein
LPRSGGWVLEREIPGEQARDAMGCYPLFTCRNWRALKADLDELDGIVSLSLVVDPFGTSDETSLRSCFQDVLVRFKEHFVVDLDRSIDTAVSAHHRYYSRKALERVDVERCNAPEEHLDEWVELYRHLIARHELTGIKAFSRNAFAAQLRVPGLVMLRATSDGETVGAHLWYRQGPVAYSHLTALNPRGYDLMASYALYWFAMKTFAEEVSWLNLGAGSGAETGPDDGLTAFKRGWTTDTRQAYFCGRVFDRPMYERLSGARPGPVGYFPAYRSGEFV